MPDFPFLYNLAEPAALLKNFPRNLVQPPDSFRFSSDALLLAALLPPVHGSATLLDLGTGCGVVALAMLRRYPSLVAVGIDKEPKLVDTAKENALRLGLQNRFFPMQKDCALLCASQNILLATEAPLLTPGSFDLVLANPPYYIKGTGRPPRSPLRERAMTANPETLTIFCQAAAWALKPKGRFGLVFPASRLTDLVQALQTAGLGLRLLKPVYGKASSPAKLILAEARKGVCSHPQLAPPLILYSGEGRHSCLTPEALAFCPELL